MIPSIFGYFYSQEISLSHETAIYVRGLAVSLISPKLVERCDSYLKGIMCLTRAPTLFVQCLNVAGSDHWLAESTSYIIGSFSSVGYFDKLIDCPPQIMYDKILTSPFLFIEDENKCFDSIQSYLERFPKVPPALKGKFYETVKVYKLSSENSKKITQNEDIPAESRVKIAQQIVELSIDKQKKAQCEKQEEEFKRKVLYESLVIQVSSYDPSTPEPRCMLTQEKPFITGLYPEFTLTVELPYYKLNGSITIEYSVKCGHEWSSESDNLEIPHGKKEAGDFQITHKWTDGAKSVKFICHSAKDTLALAIRKLIIG